MSAGGVVKIRTIHTFSAVLILLVRRVLALPVPAEPLGLIACVSSNTAIYSARCMCMECTYPQRLMDPPALMLFAAIAVQNPASLHGFAHTFTSWLPSR